MHIAEGVLSPAVLATGYALTAAGTALGLKKLDYDRLMTVAILAATFFVGSLIHVPIGITSAHLILNGLLGVILGWAAFPAILAALALQALLFQFGGLVVLGVNTFWGSGLHPTVLAVPVILLPYLLMLLGLSLAFAALGVYVRDLGQLIGALVMVVLFTSTVFFPRAMVPAALAGIVDLNPISWPVEALRGALLHGQWPAPAGLLAYSAAAVTVLLLGALCFRALRRGFADVL